MVRRPDRLLGRCRYLLLAVALIPLWVASPASARYSVNGSGDGNDGAGTLAIPAAPTLTVVSLIGLTCTVKVTYAASPAGEQTTIFRQIGTGAATQIAGPFTAAGSYTDTVLLTIVSGPPSYYLVAAWTNDTLWTAQSTPVTATAC